MELKEFIRLLKKHRRLIWIAVGIFLLAGFFLWQYQSRFYQASFSVNIDRKNYQETEEYRHDQFYRLQADEKFAENITYWINDPGLLVEAGEEFSAKGGENFSSIKSLQARQPSSNYVKVEYKSLEKQAINPAFQSLKTALDNKAEVLNSDKDDPTWFKLEYGNLAVHKNQPSVWLYLAVSAVAGLVAGIFLTLFVHYFKEENSHENRS
ncbi:MAG: hypothetical protein U5L10_04625 [Candidatus Moranbacteria bacterium]|nr:hypothetical protein [Candidatus Moranbacteria bacterium]